MIRKTKLFSVVIASYNTGKYIEKAIESLINQNIDFEKYIEIIIVDDGSTDDTKNICQKYAENFPNNIRYFFQENQGVSCARNNGIVKSSGEWISFLDADDYYGENAMQEAYSFIKKNKEVVDVLAMPIYFFYNRIGPHMLNDKFKKTKNNIIDCQKNPTFFVLQSGSTFISKKVFSKYVFPEKQKYAEDSALLMNIISEKKQYGILPLTKYNYRKREDSVLQNSKETSYWFSFFEDYAIPMLKKHKTDSQYYSYVQNVLMYDSQWRMKESLPIDADFEKYKSVMITFICQIDDDIIQKQRYLSNIQKEFLLQIKQDGKWPALCELNNKQEVRIIIENVACKNDILMIQGQLDTLYHIHNICIVDNEQQYKNKYLSPSDCSISGIKIYKASTFLFEIPLKNLVKNRTFNVWVNDKKISNISFLDDAGLNSKIKNANIVYIHEKTKYFLGFNHKEKFFYVNKYSFFKMLIKERRVYKELKKKAFPDYTTILKIRLLLRISRNKHACLNKLSKYFRKFFQQYTLESIMIYILDILK